VVVNRRSFVISGAAAVTAIRLDSEFFTQDEQMYGLIGKMTAVPGKRDELIAISSMGSPACRAA
jgi:hypothetical protein